MLAAAGIDADFAEFDKCLVSAKSSFGAGFSAKTDSWDEDFFFTKRDLG